MEVDDKVFEMLAAAFKPKDTYTKYEVKMLCLDAMRWFMDNVNKEVEDFKPAEFFKLKGLE